jgi:hypothetical protein
MKCSSMPRMGVVNCCRALSTPSQRRQSYAVRQCCRKVCGVCACACAQGTHWGHAEEHA